MSFGAGYPSLHVSIIVSLCGSRATQVTRINAHLGNVVYVAGNQWGMLDLEKGTVRPAMSLKQLVVALVVPSTCTNYIRAV